MEEGLLTLHELTKRLIKLSKDTRTNVGKVGLTINGLKQEGAKVFNRLLAIVDSIKSKVDSSNNKLSISSTNSSSSFSKSVESLKNASITICTNTFY